MFHILYVCTGNTCRSPMAEGLLRQILADEGVDDVEVSSAGIGTLDGYPATLHAVMATKKRGVDISEHHSTRMSRERAEAADLILALADEHHDYIRRLGSFEDKLFMVKGFPEPGHADYLHSVKDPIGGTLDEYTRVLDELEREIRRALPGLLKRIKEKQE